jgi:hypothetical protein
LLLDAVSHMLKASRITRRLASRPYFPLARRLFDLVAPIFAVEPLELDRLLATPTEHHRPNGQPHSSEQIAGATPSRRRKRRGRRSGRGRNRRFHRTDGSGSEAQSG